MMVFISINAFSQTKSIYLRTLPKGYQINDVNGEPGANIEVDIDKDGINDLAIVLYSIKSGESILCIYLSSNFNTDQSYQWCNLSPLARPELSFNNNILSYSAYFSNMIEDLKLSYNTVIKKMKVVSDEVNGKKEILKLKDSKKPQSLIRNKTK